MTGRSMLFVLTLIWGLGLAARADQPEPEKSEQKDPGFVFTPEITVRCTSIKNQAKTNTCWSFASASFVESELLRMGKGEHDLSEMFVVRYTYPLKAQRFVRLHGSTTLAGGSLAADALRIYREYGAAPEFVYDGKYAGQSRHNHAEMDEVIHAMLKAVVANRGASLNPAWPAALEGVLDAYLGQVPASFNYEGKTFSPREFADWLGFQPDDYVEFTSYLHHPFYQQVNLEVPDNWAGNRYWNVPLDQLMEIMMGALQQGYTVAWDGDVSEKSFKHKLGVAILPQRDWDDRTSDEQDKICQQPEPEMEVTQQLRQQQFDNYLSTDDHLMHLTGTARDQNGTLYFVVKNSWGTLDSEYGGFVHLSDAYVRAKTISIMVHRDVVPRHLAARLGLRHETRVVRGAQGRPAPSN